MAGAPSLCPSTTPENPLPCWCPPLLSLFPGQPFPIHLPSFCASVHPRTPILLPIEAVSSPFPQCPAARESRTRRRRSSSPCPAATRTRRRRSKWLLPAVAKHVRCHPPCRIHDATRAKQAWLSFMASSPRRKLAISPSLSTSAPAGPAAAVQCATARLAGDVAIAPRHCLPYSVADTRPQVYLYRRGR